MSAAEPYEPGVSPDDHEKHVAWLDSLSDDDKLVVYTPVGYQHLMLCAAYVKRALQYEMPAGERLELLEKLHSLTDLYFTPEMLAIIEPMSDTEIEMMHEARSLNREEDRAGQASFKILTSWRVFGYFLRLNPSYLAAIKLRERMTAARSPAPVRFKRTLVEPVRMSALCQKRTLPRLFDHLVGDGE